MDGSHRYPRICSCHGGSSPRVVQQLRCTGDDAPDGEKQCSGRCESKGLLPIYEGHCEELGKELGEIYLRDAPPRRKVHPNLMTTSTSGASRAKLISWVLLFSCNLMWALQFTCIKLVQDQAGPLFTVWFPTAISLLVLYPFVSM